MNKEQELQGEGNQSQILNLQNQINQSQFSNKQNLEESQQININDIKLDVKKIPTTEQIDQMDYNKLNDLALELFGSEKEDCYNIIHTFNLEQKRERLKQCILQLQPPQELSTIKEEEKLNLNQQNWKKNQEEKKLKKKREIQALEEWYAEAFPNADQTDKIRFQNLCDYYLLGQNNSQSKLDQKIAESKEDKVLKEWYEEAFPQANLILSTSNMMDFMKMIVFNMASLEQKKAYKEKYLAEQKENTELNFWYAVVYLATKAMVSIEELYAWIDFKELPLKDKREYYKQKIQMAKAKKIAGIITQNIQVNNNTFPGLEKQPNGLYRITHTEAKYYDSATKWNAAEINEDDVQLQIIGDDGTVERVHADIDIKQYCDAFYDVFPQALKDKIKETLNPNQIKKFTQSQVQQDPQLINNPFAKKEDDKIKKFTQSQVQQDPQLINNPFAKKEDDKIKKFTQSQVQQDPQLINNPFSKKEDDKIKKFTQSQVQQDPQLINNPFAKKEDDKIKKFTQSQVQQDPQLINNPFSKKEDDKNQKKNQSCCNIF